MELVPVICRYVKCGREFCRPRGSRTVYCCPECQAAARKMAREKYRKLIEASDIRKTPEHQEWHRRRNRKPSEPGRINKALRDCKERGISYAERQKESTMKLYGIRNPKEV